MRIGPFENPSEAHTLLSAAHKRGLQAQLVEQAGRCWLEITEAQQAEFGQLLQQYRQDPASIRAQAWQDEALAEPVEPWRAERKASQGWSRLLRSLSLWQLLVVGTCLLVFAAMHLGWHSILNGLLFSQWPYQAPEIRQGEVWRLLTPVFLHFSLMHLAFNLLWFWQLSTSIGRYFPAYYNPALLLLSGVAGNLLQYVWSPQPFGGMSGVVYGLLGFLWWQGRHPAALVRIPVAIVYFMLGWLALGFSGVLDSVVPMANMAHLGGLLAGIAMAQGWRWCQVEKVR